MDDDENKFFIISKISVSNFVYIEDLPDDNDEFYIYEECKFNEELMENLEYYYNDIHINFDGSIKFPEELRPNVVNWTIDRNILENESPDDDEYPISTLYHVLQKYLKPARIQVDGYIMLISENKIYFYHIVDYKPVLHINKTIDLTELWKHCQHFYDEINIDDREFYRILNIYLPNETSYESFREDLIDGLDLFDRLYQYLI
jgi:hypothetical protein